MSNKLLLTFGEVMGRIEPCEQYMRLTQAVPGNLRFTFAGAEANVAASYSLLGGKVRYVTALPESPLTDTFIRQMRGFDIDVSKIVKTDQGRMGIFFTETGADQRPSQVWYDRGWSSISMCAPDTYDWDDIFDNVGWLHISGITPALSENAAKTSIAIVKEASARNIKVSIDLNFRKKLWKWRPGTPATTLAGEVIGEMLNHAYLVIGNEEDAHDVLGINAGNSDVAAGNLDIEKYPDVARSISRLYPNVEYVACTLRQSISANHNNWGAMLWRKSDDKAYLAPMDNGNYEPYRITDIIDRVGGGDSFAAALLFAMNDKELSANPNDMIAFATAASCLCHTIKGDFNYTTRAEAESLMKGNSTGRVNR